MRSRGGFYNLFSRDRKILYIILCIVSAFVLTLTVVYAALSTTLNISGNAEVSAANWDIYLDNVVLNNGSATTNAPIITNSRTASFSTELTKPGDFYEFTIDVVNNGSIDAMIDSVTKIPELNATQKRYLNYIVEYQNGEAISTKQLVSKNSFVRLKVRVEFRNDISISDLPTSSETLNLSFGVNYVQSDNSGVNVKDDGIERYKVVSGDLDTAGSEVCIRDECFYVISSTNDSVTMLTKYNLYVGGEYDYDTEVWTAYGEAANGIQNSTMFGSAAANDDSINDGVIPFSSTNYWKSSVINYPAYVYDNNSILYNYIENYRIYLEENGAIVEETRLLNVEELSNFGCDFDDVSCTNMPSWVYSSTYWTGVAADIESSADYLYFVYGYNAFLLNMEYNSNVAVGLRPVITISR